MTRREVFRGVLAGVFGLVGLGAMSKRTSRWGFVDVNRHTELKKQGIELRIFHRGVDVTHRCESVNDEQAIAVAYVPGQQGWKRDGDGPMKEVLHGVDVVARPYTPNL